MATITKTPSNAWKAVIRKRGWPVTIKTFPTKRDAADWARSTEDEMVRGVYINRAGAERLLFDKALERFLAEVSASKRTSTAYCLKSLFFTGNVPVHATLGLATSLHPPGSAANERVHRSLFHERGTCQRPSRPGRGARISGRGGRDSWIKGA
ncbi:MAG: hypothetical protein H6953_07480 [Chromatiaceae bacterium]|nr:hypothetical protein [Chromatiaceae bacterium]MCP5315229.1 hypothetical protein [Chromatiaceae bacterium]MCP5428656.1 hypothetical protein [Chromatiaceae bacterium]